VSLSEPERKGRPLRTWINQQAPLQCDRLTGRFIQGFRSDNFQALRSADDWWTIALGTGLRWTIEQMGPEAAERVKADNVGWLQENRIDRVETNAIYAVGTKRS